MGRGGRIKKKKMWNRKRKAEDADKEGDGTEKAIDDQRKDWTLVTQLQNHNFETYYAYQGLHALRKNNEDEGGNDKIPTFVQCDNDEEMEEERVRFMSSMRTRLPASFRIGRHMDEELTNIIIKDVKEFAGTEMELLMDSEGNSVNKREMSNNDDDEVDDDEDVDCEENQDTNSGKKSNATTSETFVKKLAPAKAIPYVPNAYQLSVDRRTIRRNPSLAKFHEWLKVQQEAGFITRQETVSMIPPVVLDAQPHHAVLDMCAAPGSKTCQLLEIISTIPEGETEPTGYVVANDSDDKRAYMLVHQLRRLNSPAYFISACDGQFFPMLKGSEDRVITDEEKALEGIFDRVLCDVPCTGDGTARKNPGIWKRWLATNGQAMHPLQVNIALRGARLTKVGGYLCYSTCSLNPMENEAVVAEILRATDGSLELVDKRPEMKGFVARPGWSTWKVVTEALTKRDKNKLNKKNKKMRKKEEGINQEEENAQGEETSDNENTGIEIERDQETNNVPSNIIWKSSPESWDETTLRNRLESRGMIEFEKVEDVGTYKHVKRSMFPPTDEERKEFHLERCMRCLPHDMDTGGFFIALFRKCKPLGERARRKAEALEKQLLSDQEGSSDAAGKNIDSNINEMKEENCASGNKKKRNYEKAGNEDFVAVDDKVIGDLVSFFGLSDGFAKNQLMARGTPDSKILYFISSSVKKSVFDTGLHCRVKGIHSGLRAFERRSRKENNKG